MECAVSQHDVAGPSVAASLEELRAEVARLTSRLANAESSLLALREHCESLEAAKARMARLCVASAQLHATADPIGCLSNIQDIIFNLVGSEETGIWGLSPDGRCLELRASQGIDVERWRLVPVGEGDLGTAACTGHIVVPEAPAAGQPSACVPLRAGEHVVGAIAVFSLLPQRSSLGPHDCEVFELLARQAAFVLGYAGGPWLPRSGDCHV